MGGYMRQINPSVKVIAILASALIISFSPSVFWNAAIVVVCFASLLISGCMSRKVLNVLLPATLASLSIFMALLLRGSSGKEVFESSGNFLVSASSASDIGDAAAVALRIYAYAREYSQTKLAIEVRGLKLWPWSLKPLSTALVNSLHWAENVAMAMESKGFDGKADRTYYLNLHVRYQDFVWAIFMIAISMAWIWF